MHDTTGLLVGRAYALANTAGADRHDPATELCELAGGDRSALVLASARFRQFLARPSRTVEDSHALRLLEAALARFDRTCPV